MAERDQRSGAEGRCDPVAFENVFRAHYHGLCRYVTGYVGSAETAADLVQDLFLTLWERCEAGEELPRSPAYFYRAARNRAITELRHRRVATRYVDAVSPEPEPTASPADDDVRAREIAHAYERALAELPPRCREIFLMRRQQDMPPSQIAETLGLSVKTVDVQIWRALKALRASLAPFLAIALPPFTS
jgi:RNA polymerase sigma-70 factor (ECF subfamily)